MTLKEKFTKGKRKSTVHKFTLFLVKSLNMINATVRRKNSIVLVKYLYSKYCLLCLVDLLGYLLITHSTVYGYVFVLVNFPIRSLLFGKMKLLSVSQATVLLSCSLPFSSRCGLHLPNVCMSVQS